MLVVGADLDSLRSLHASLTYVHNLVPFYRMDYFIIFGT